MNEAEPPALVDIWEQVRAFVLFKCTSSVEYTKERMAAIWNYIVGVAISAYTFIQRKTISTFVLAVLPCVILAAACLVYLRHREVEFEKLLHQGRVECQEKLQQLETQLSQTDFSYDWADALRTIAKKYEQYENKLFEARK